MGPNGTQTNNAEGSNDCESGLLTILSWGLKCQVNIMSDTSKEAQLMWPAISISQWIVFLSLSVYLFISNEHTHRFISTVFTFDSGFLHAEPNLEPFYIQAQLSKNNSKISLLRPPKIKITPLKRTFLAPILSFVTVPKCSYRPLYCPVL